MRTTYMTVTLDTMKGSETIAVEGLGTSGAASGAAGGPASTREAPQTDSAAELAERERRIERWMEDVKSFIRNIDLNTL